MAPTRILENRSALSPLDAEAREHVLEFVVKRLGTAIAKAPAAPTPPAAPRFTPPPPNPAGTPPAGDMDIRTFAGLKSPKTLNEKVAVVAFSLTRPVYDMSSVATHVAKERKAVVRIKLYVVAVLHEMLEI